MAIRYRVPDIEYYVDLRSFREIVLDSAQLYNAVNISRLQARRLLYITVVSLRS